MACYYTGAAFVLFLVALFAKAPATLLWILAGLLVWFSKGIWQHREEAD